MTHAQDRIWCLECAELASASCAGHRTKRVGAEVALDICVADRRLDLDQGKHAYFNMVGHAEGRSVAQHERHTKQRIEEMRRQDMANRRERRINHKMNDAPRRTGAIPMAKLFALKRQYGNDFTQAAVDVMKREGAYWGDE